METTSTLETNNFKYTQSSIEPSVKDNYEIQQYFQSKQKQLRISVESLVNSRPGKKGKNDTRDEKKYHSSSTTKEQQKNFDMMRTGGGLLQTSALLPQIKEINGTFENELMLNEILATNKFAKKNYREMITPKK